MKTTDLLTASPQEVKEHLLTPDDSEGVMVRDIMRHHAILINLCDRIAYLETLCDRLATMLPDVS